MYGNYVPNDEAESDTSPTDFNLQDLIESSRRFKKKDHMKSTMSMKPVRWNTGSKPKIEEPVRMTATGKQVAAKYQERMKALGASASGEDLNNSFIEDPLHKMVETPRHHPSKPSPDSGSLTEDALRSSRNNTNASIKETDTDASLLRLLQPLSLNTPLASLKQPQDANDMDKMENLSRIEDRLEPDRDSGSFTSDTSRLQERNIKMELFADPKPDHTNTATTNLTQPTTATKSMDLSKYQPVRMRLAMPDMEPVAAVRNKENKVPQKRQIEAAKEAGHGDKMSIRKRLQALSSAPGDRHPHELAQLEAGHGQDHDAQHRGLRFQASSRLMSAPSLMSRTAADHERTNPATVRERTMATERTNPATSRERSHERSDNSAAQQTSRTQHSFIQDILSHSSRCEPSGGSDLRPSRAQDHPSADMQNGGETINRRVQQHQGLVERERVHSGHCQVDGGIQKQTIHHNHQPQKPFSQQASSLNQASSVHRPSVHQQQPQPSSLQQQFSTPRPEGTPRPTVASVTQPRYPDPRVEGASSSGSSYATPAAKQPSLSHTPGPVHHNPASYHQTPRQSHHKQQPPAPVEIPAPAQTPAAPTKQTDRTMPPPSMSISRSATETILLINNRRYRIMKLLGKGGSSRVFEAFDEERNNVVAIKRVDLSSADEAQAAGYLNEINMLKKLQGEMRIVRMFDFEQDDLQGILYVVMEKGDTDLASLLKDYASRREITGTVIKHYWTEMLHACHVIHKHGIIHSDLKPANFLLVAGRLKLIDFGIASAVKSDQTSIVKDTQMGTFNFMSPEAIQDLSGPQFDGAGNRKPMIKISFKSDVWSLGCILYNLVYGKMPFGDIKIPIMKLQAIMNPDHRIAFPEEGVDPLLVDVLRSCLNRDVKCRPSIQELLNHSYVTGVEAPPKMDKMLKMLEGVLSPATFEKTRRKLEDAPSRKLDM